MSASPLPPDVADTPGLRRKITLSGCGGLQLQDCTGVDFLGLDFSPMSLSPVNNTVTSFVGRMRHLYEQEPDDHPWVSCFGEGFRAQELSKTMGNPEGY